MGTRRHMEGKQRNNGMNETLKKEMGWERKVESLMRREDRCCFNGQGNGRMTRQGETTVWWYRWAKMQWKKKLQKLGQKLGRIERIWDNICEEQDILTKVQHKMALLKATYFFKANTLLATCQSSIFHPTHIFPCTYFLAYISDHCKKVRSAACMI